LLDNITGKLERHFGAIHSDTAVDCHAPRFPDSTMFMESTALKPLAELAQLTIDKNEIEASVARKYFL